MRFLECLPINWERLFMETNYLLSIIQEVISLSHAKVFVFSDSVLCLGKVNQNPTSNAVWEEKLSWFTDSPPYRTSWTQMMVSRWNSSGTLSQDLPHCSSSTKVQEDQKWATHHNSRDELSWCRCSMTSYGDLKTMNGNALLTPHLWLHLPKKFSSRTLVIPRTWIRNKVVLYLQRKTTRIMGQSRWTDDDQIWRKRTPSFPSHESIVLRNAQKQKEVENDQYTSVPMGNTIETVFRTIISVNQLSIFGAVSDLCDEYSACHVRTGRPVLAGQSDPLFEPARLLITTPTPSTEVRAQEKLIAKVQRTSGKALTTRSSDKDFVLMQDSWKQLKSDSTSWEKDTDELLQTTEPVTCREYTLPPDEQATDPTCFYSSEHQIWARVWSHNQLPAR